MTDWFGEPWPSGVCETGAQRPTPVGQACGWCTTAIEDGDRGMLLPHLGADMNTVTVVPWHRECMLRSTLGSPAHLRRECSCHGGPRQCLDQSPAELRAEAQKVWEWWARGGSAGNGLIPGA